MNTLFQIKSSLKNLLIIASALGASALCAQTIPNGGVALPGITLHIYKLPNGGAFPANGTPLIKSVTTDANGFFSTPVATNPGDRVWVGSFGGNAPQMLTAALWAQAGTAFTNNSTLDLNNGQLEGRTFVLTSGQKRVGMCNRSQPSSGAAYLCKPARTGGIDMSPGLTQAPSGMTDRGIKDVGVKSVGNAYPKP